MLHIDPHNNPPESILLAFHGEMWCFIPTWSWALFDDVGLNLWASNRGVLEGRSADRANSDRGLIEPVALGKGLRFLAEQKWGGALAIKTTSIDAYRALCADDPLDVWGKVHALLGEVTSGHGWKAEKVPIDDPSAAFVQGLVVEARKEREKKK